MAEVVAMERCDGDEANQARVDAVRAALGDGSEIERLAGQFRLLGDAGRTRILYALLEGGELCVCDLAAAVSMSETAVSQALRLLRTAGIVRNRRAGRQVFYQLADAHIRLLLDLSAEHLRHRNEP